MKTDQIQLLTTTFEGHAQQTEGGVEFWLARDLQQLLGYAEWRNFSAVITKAKTACEVAGHAVANHFVDVNKMVDLGSGSQREIDEIMLSRFACYLIAQNGDPAKQEIAFAQTYFAIQTRRAELIEQRILEAERVFVRKKLTATEKELSQVIYEQTGGNQDFALIRSKGDQALFAKSTQAMKAQWKVPDSRPLADFAPTIILKAKDFATEITIHNAREHAMASEAAIHANTLPTTTQFDERFSHAAFVQKFCLRPRTSRKSSAASLPKEKRHSRIQTLLVPSEIAIAEQSIRNRINIKHTAPPRAAADLLQRRPQPRVIRQSRIGGQVGTRWAPS
jgi:DNA-damage-inducible protein D